MAPILMQEGKGLNPFGPRPTPFLAWAAKKWGFREYGSKVFMIRFDNLLTALFLQSLGCDLL
jgi:hypothetical protein